VTTSLIVARMDPADADAVGELFAASDAGELPHLLQVRSRILFRFHDLYFHLVQTRDALPGQLEAARTHPLFAGLSRDLEAYIRPYSPDWRGPRDALATPFYTWLTPDAADSAPQAAAR
jgi:cyclase